MAGRAAVVRGYKEKQRYVFPGDRRARYDRGEEGGGGRAGGRRGPGCISGVSRGGRAQREGEGGGEGKKSDKKLTLPKAGIGRDRSHWPAAKKSHRISGRGEICN